MTGYRLDVPGFIPEGIGMLLNKVSKQDIRRTSQLFRNVRLKAGIHLVPS
jgi:hypothetical protein